MCARPPVSRGSTRFYPDPFFEADIVDSVEASSLLPLIFVRAEFHFCVIILCVGMKKDENKMEKIVALAKQRGFIYQGSEIYGGLAGTWDYGPNGVALKNNIKNLWWRQFVDSRSDMYGLDASILMNSQVWEASGHIGGFNDPLIECIKCKKRFRADYIGSDVCPECGGKLGPQRWFNMMFRTHIGTVADSDSVTYLRPETAGGIFINFKNILDTMHPTLPFGIAQIGKAFRNEIAPRDFVFRVRELEQMEIEWFCEEGEWEKWFTHWQEKMHKWIDSIGLSKNNVHELDVPKEELAHYSKRTIDFEYDFPFGRNELYGLAYRTDFDLSVQQDKSGVDLSYYDQKSNKRFLPHVVEPSFGIDRTVLALLSDVYTEEIAPTANGKEETRVVLKFKPVLAPIKIAVLPLMSKEELKKKAMEIYEVLNNEFICHYDTTGSIGKRYRRHDEIGTPYCLTVDFDTLEDNAVTIRDRDTMKQDRIPTAELIRYFKEKLL